jgi:signal transduction histidine kinase
MRERASQLRGTLSVSSTPGNGTEIVLQVPYSVGRAGGRVDGRTGTPENSEEAVRR